MVMTHNSINNCYDKMSLSLLSTILFVVIFMCSVLSSVGSPENNTIFKSSSEEEKSKNVGTNRIVGGTFVPVGTYPWFTLLSYKPGLGLVEYEQGCGGILVSPEWVLTAAHCIDYNMKKNGAVRVGALSFPFSVGNNGGQYVESFNVISAKRHPDYNHWTSQNDFGLLHLDGSSTITPVPMDSNNLSETYSTGELHLDACMRFVKQSYNA